MRRLFSEELHRWLRRKGDKTLVGLTDLFGEKSFAVVFLLLMALPALPLPTGGVTHVTELITMLLSLELILGRKSVWLPRRWRQRDTSDFLNGKAVQKLMGVIGWFERYSKKRWNFLMVRNPLPSLIGLIVLLFTIAAFVAPPFSGLDTLPAMGVVIMSLGLLLEDGLFLLIGVAVGGIGIGVELAAGAALYDGLRHLLHYV